jgi:hypothetical protein
MIERPNELRSARLAISRRIDREFELLDVFVSVLTLCKINQVHSAITASLSAGSELVTRGFTGAIMPVEQDAVIVRRRQQVNAQPLRQVRNCEFSKAQTFPRLRLQFDHKRAVTTLRA